MEKNVKKTKKTPLIVKATSFAGIKTFKQKPTDAFDGRSTRRSDVGMSAADLFSFFTADIIKEEKLFIR